MKKIETQQIVLYDGRCNFCIGIINFIKKKDKKNTFSYLPIQSKEARNILRSTNEAFINLKTLYLVIEQNSYKRSMAIFKIFQQLPYPWKLVSLFKIFPLFITDFFYKVIARYRYKLFGQAQELYFPDRKIKSQVYSEITN
jgi:predicted DCC family thiol-disulfide oxidoreductase YuxK